MLERYRGILTRPGAAAFCATGLVGRMPISMVGLGIVLLVSATTGSYATAGAVSAAYLVAGAAMAVVMGRLIDRLGQARVLTPALTVYAVALALLAWSMRADAPLGLAYALAALAGLAQPPIGSCVRARWSHLLTDDQASLQTAYALEAVVDEAVFMLGPILATVLATSIDPSAGLVAAVVLGTVGGYAFAALRTSEPPPNPRPDQVTGRAPMPWGTVIMLTVLSAALGALFGNAEVTTVAFAQEQGAKGYAGPLLALWALGSLLAGLITGAISWRAPLARRLRLGALAMTVATAPLFAIDHVWLMGLALLIGGFSIAPTLIATMSLVESRVPRSRLLEGMAFVQTGIIAGVAPGSALGGLVVDAHGASPAYLVSAGAGALAVLAALALPSAGTAAERH